MIVARSPLRITLGGGGTDLPSYSNGYGGFAMTATIDAHVTVALRTDPISAAGGQALPGEHPIVAATFQLMDIDPAGVSVVSLSDVPPGTGLGSSASFTTALVAALYSYRGIRVDRERLAETASQIEIDRLDQPVGRQDQYAVAFGGLLAMEFADGKVRSTPLPLARSTVDRLERELMLFYTGFSRAAADVLEDQDRRTRRAEPAMLENLHAIKDIALRSREVLLDGDCTGFGRLLDQHWRLKRARSENISNAQIDHWYETARRAGATGGKLIGAGNGGFLLLHAIDPEPVREALRRAGLQERRFGFVSAGTELLR